MNRVKLDITDKHDGALLRTPLQLLTGFEFKGADPESFQVKGLAVANVQYLHKPVLASEMKRIFPHILFERGRNVILEFAEKAPEGLEIYAIVEDWL